MTENCRRVESITKKVYLYLFSGSNSSSLFHAENFWGARAIPRGYFSGGG